VHTPDEQAWDRSDLQQEVEVENVADYRYLRHELALTISLCHPDISDAIPIGTIYLRGTLGQLRKALAEDVSRLLSDLEVGVSKARRASLSFTGDGCPVYRSRMVVPRVVRNSRKSR